MRGGRGWACAAAAAALLALAAAAARRPDQDFEFDDDAEAGGGSATADAGHLRRPRRYIYDPHNSLCQSLVCKRREVCLLRDAFTALCANKKEILRKGDVIVASSRSGSESEEGGGWGRDDDDVFLYDALAPGADDVPPDDLAPDRCVGCPVRSRAQFLCGSDNRTYSSLCRLDLHNCVRRPARPVRLACRGFCPCRDTDADVDRDTDRDARNGHVAHAHRAPRPQRRRAPRPARQRASRRNFDEYDDEWRRRKQDPEHNEVLPERSSRRRPSQGSEGCALDKMANRLLDWFSVLMEEAGATTAPDDGYPSDCKPEVRWMFAHLDTDGDGVLSATNLYSLRHDDRERCLRPFLSSCDGGDGGDGVSRAAWCGCLRRAARPCAALARAHPAPRPGAYVPACDARGFYRPRQCHAALGVCWCVDAHGAEVAGTRTKGAAACGRPPAPARPPDVPDAPDAPDVPDAPDAPDAREGAPADDEDAPGSGDAELRF